MLECTMQILNEQVVTAWVLEHPAHFQLLSPFIKKGDRNDVLIITTREECMNMYKKSKNYLPDREVFFVERPFAKNYSRLKTLLKVIKRRIRVKRFLNKRQKNNPIDRIVVMGASLELLSAKAARINQRIYISDTEIHHLAHKLALRSATDVLLPKYWRKDLDDGFSEKCKKYKINLLIHENIHAEMRVFNRNHKCNDRIICRLLEGGGNHDSKEILDVENKLHLINGKIDFFNEGFLHENPWELCNLISQYSSVITQSTTFAAEAAIQNIPTLLFSKAKRGFLSELLSRNKPLIQCLSISDFENSVKEWEKIKLNQKK